jgi:hypothetical protein
MQCEERDRLMDFYLAAAYKNEQAEKKTGHLKIKAWLEMTSETRRAYEAALLALNRHKSEHGC